MAEKPRDDLNTADALPQTGGGRKKIMLFAGGLAVLIALSVGLTILFSSSMLPEAEPMPEQNQAPANTGLETELEALQIQVASQAEAIARLEAELGLLRESSSARQLQNTLASQERSFQLFLAAMKEGMADIANMVRGSRTWLEHYEGRLDEVIDQSRKRVEALSADASAPVKTPVTIEP